MTVDYVRGLFVVKDCWNQKDQVKAIAGSKWDRQRMAWLMVANSVTVDALEQILNTDFTYEAKQKCKEIKVNMDEANGIKVAEHVEPCADIPVRAKLFMHQVKAFNFVMKIFCRQVDESATK